MFDLTFSPCFDRGRSPKGRYESLLPSLLIDRHIFILVKSSDRKPLRQSFALNIEFMCEIMKCPTGIRLPTNDRIFTILRDDI